MRLGELTLRGAAGMGEGGGCFWGEGGGGGSRCAGLLNRERKKAALGGAPAAWGCPIEGVRRLLWGELPLRGAARLGEGGCCVWGSSRCAELLGWGREEAAFGWGGAPCSRCAGLPD